jgi:hypothetical protein
MTTMIANWRFTPLLSIGDLVFGDSAFLCLVEISTNGD